MKPNVFVFIFSLFFYQSYAQIVSIPDANFKNALVNNTNINTNGDDEIQVAEAEAYNLGIDVKALNISDLTGIEAFVNITSLECSENNLTTLDVSQNTALMIVMCGSNQLSSLDLGQNNALTMLLCPSNSLTALNVSQNTNLNSLFCPNNQLISLDLTQNTVLVSLNCMINQLTDLDLRNGNNPNIEEDGIYTDSNPNLTCIFVDDANYATDNWLYIDAASTFVETETACENLAITSLTTTSAKIYPNPVENWLHIQTDTAIKNATIYTAQGNKVMTFKEDKVILEKLSSGFYFLVIEDETGNYHMKSFVKK